MSETQTKTWRLGGAAGYSIHAVGTETRGVRAYTHVELRGEKINERMARVGKQSFKLSPSDNAVNGATPLRDILAVVKCCAAPPTDIDFLCELVGQAFLHRAI